jgi:hypothetical protein
MICPGGLHLAHGAPDKTGPIRFYSAVQDFPYNRERTANFLRLVPGATQII